MKQISLALMSLLYITGGIAHFAKPQMYLKMMPPIFPAPLALVYLSGVAEIALGVLLWIPSLRPWAAWGIIALLVAVFPANLYMYQQGQAVFGIRQEFLLLRLPIQGLLIAWAYWHTR